jgi:protein-disulfide isomerase
MARIVEEALQPYETRVRYVFRQFPLSMHPFAWKAAEAALAANAQGKFFPYERILFANQKQLDVASLKRYASEAGLDRKRFDDDLDSGRFARDVIEDRRDGMRAGVRGTPMFFINGAMLPDEGYSVEGMRKALESALGDRP